MTIETTYSKTGYIRLIGQCGRTVMAISGNQPAKIAVSLGYELNLNLAIVYATNPNKPIPKRECKPIEINGIIWGGNEHPG